MNRERKMEPSAKRQKLLSCRTTSFHSYPMINEEEDSETYQRNLIKLDKEIGLKKPSVGILKELMKRLYSGRRKWVLQVANTSQDIWTKFPLLRKTSFVSLMVVILTALIQYPTEFYGF